MEWKLKSLINNKTYVHIMEENYTFTFNVYQQKQTLQALEMLKAYILENQECSSVEMYNINIIISKLEKN